ncbi:MAG: acyltransferase family protein [Saprospiraceae bacterium]|nr:acyltransferase family protein [Saprospiraceae bacterium]
MTRLQDLLRRTTSGAAWLPEIDGLRFVAILPVVLQHLLERFYRYTQVDKPAALFDDQFAFFISRGTVGVFLFFAISGFVLALPFAKSVLNDKPPVPLKQYYLRRLTRIEPPYLIWMTVFALVLLVKGTYLLPELFQHWLATVTYTHNLIFHDYTRINPVAWSLEVEIQFYLVAPFLAMAYFRVRNKWYRRIGLVAVIFLAITLQTYSGGPIPFWLKASILGQIQHFLIGFLLTDLYLTEWKAGVAKHRIWDLLAVLAFVVMCYTWSSEYLKNLLFALALCTLFMAAFKGVAFRHMLQNTWIAVTGGMCYTIYLIHLPMLEGFMHISNKIALGNGFWLNFIVQVCICLPVVWGVSALFFILLEKPFMQKKFPMPAWSRDAIQRLRRLAGGTALLVLCCLFPCFGHAQTEGVETQFLLQKLSSDSATVGAAKLKIMPDTTLPAAPLLNLKLKPLAVLCDLAVLNSHDVKAKQLDMAKQDLAISIQRRSWAELLSANISGLYGNASALDASSDGFGTRYVLTDRKQTGYNLSVALKITGADVLTRGQKTELLRVQRQRYQEEQGTIQAEIRATTIKMYCQLELAIKQVAAKVDMVESNRVTISIAEKYFQEGNLPISEYSILSSVFNKAKEELMNAQSEALQQVLLFREFVGADIWEH